MHFVNLFCSVTLWLTASVEGQKGGGGLTKVSASEWAVGGNPTKLDMFYYAPPGLPPNSPIVVAVSCTVSCRGITNTQYQIHYCLGSASAYHGSANFVPSANQYKFAVIYPQATHDNRCWEVNTLRTLTRGGGGDSDGIAKMVNYVLTKHKSDKKRIFVLGSSSGGMMTNVMAATYPNLFSGAASFSGIPYGCLEGSRGASPFTDNFPCVKGGNIKTGQQWAAMVKNTTRNPWTGAYPPIQIWHQTRDPVVNFKLANEQIKQWTTVHGISNTPTKNLPGTPKAQTTKHIYGDGTKVVSFEVAGAGHPCPVNIPEVLKWFKIAP
jgi:acetylxylan esterase